MDIENARAAHADLVQRMVDAAEQIEQADDTADLDQLEQAFDEAEASVERSKRNLDRLEKAVQARQDSPPPNVAITTSSTTTSNTSPAGDVRYAVAAGTSRPEHVYRPDIREYTFLSDIARATLRGDAAASERLHRNDQIVRETRDVTTGDPGAGSFVPPVYLGSLWQEKLRSQRVVANLIPAFDVGSVGMSFTVPKVNTGTSVASQAGENTNLSETDADSNTLTAYLETLGGLQDTSMQALERTDPAWEDVIMDDLTRAYNEEVEQQVLHGAGHGSNELPGLLGVTGNIDVTWTETTPAGTTGLLKVYDCISQQGTAEVTSRVIAMHPRRSAWFASQTTTAAPIFSQGGLTYASGNQDNGYVGNLAGLPVYASTGILTTRGASTNQDVIFVLDPGFLRFGETTPRVEVFRDVLSQTGTVRIRLYAYCALIADRLPSAIANIEGTGLVTPSF